MKLLYCNDCGDIVALSMDVRTCRCRKSAGCYDINGDDVKVSGPCRVLCLDNRDLAWAKAYRNETAVVKAWVLPKEYRKIVRSEGGE